MAETIHQDSISSHIEKLLTNDENLQNSETTLNDAKSTQYMDNDLISDGSQLNVNNVDSLKVDQTSEKSESIDNSALPMKLTSNQENKFVNNKPNISITVNNEYDQGYICQQNNNLVDTPKDITNNKPFNETETVDETEPENEKLHPFSPAPPINIKVFLGRIPRTFDEKQLYDAVSAYGNIIETIVLRDRFNGQHRGSGFVKFESIYYADCCIRELTKKREKSSEEMNARYANGEAERIGLSPTLNPLVDHCKLFVGSIARTAESQELSAIFEPYGSIEEAFILRNTQTNESKGCGFVRMAYKEQALWAMSSLDGKYKMARCIRPLEVRFADTKQKGATSKDATSWKEYVTLDGRPYYYNDVTNITTWERPAELGVLPMMGGYYIRPETIKALSTSAISGPPGANLFIFHIPNDWTSTELIQMFMGCGTIVSGKIATDKVSGRNRGFGFVSYATLSGAANAITHLNGIVVKGKRLKVAAKKGEEQQLKDYVENEVTNYSETMVPMVQQHIPIGTPQIHPISYQQYPMSAVMPGSYGMPTMAYSFPQNNLSSRDPKQYGHISQVSNGYSPY